MHSPRLMALLQILALVESEPALGIGYSNIYQNKLCENLPMEIQGKTVLVTGASSGIGSAIAKAMAQAGAAVVLLIARRENDLKKVAAEIGTSGGNTRIYPVDLSNPDQVTVIAQRTQGGGWRSRHHQQCRVCRPRSGDDGKRLPLTLRTLLSQLSGRLQLWKCSRSDISWRRPVS